MVSSSKGWYETHSSPTSFRVCVSCSFSLPPYQLPSSSSDIDAPLLPGCLQGWEEGTFPARALRLVPLLPCWLHSQNQLMIADNIWSVNRRFLVFKNKDQVLEKRAWKQCVNDRKQSREDMIWRWWNRHTRRDFEEQIILPAVVSLLLVGEESNKRADKEQHSSHIGTLHSKGLHTFLVNAPIF